MSSRVIIPPLRKHLSAQGFFAEFVNINKERHKGFSFRTIAAKLDWPISYMSDVIKGRKSFTVLRAIEFAKKFNLNSINTERLVHLALAEHSDTKVRDHFSANLNVDVNKWKRSATPTPQIFEDIELEAVFNALKWARGRINAAEIKDLLFTFNVDLSLEKILKIIEELIQNEMIRAKRDKTFEILKFEITHDEFAVGYADCGIAIHERYANNFIRFTKNKEIPCMYNSGFLELPTDQFNDIASRLLEVRNWLYDISAVTSKDSKTKLKDTFIYQFDINLVNILNRSVVAKLEK